MMLCDAQWLARVLAEHSVDELSPVLNLGSGSRHFRETQQPHIHALIFAPLEARGVRVIHSDLSKGAGVDISGDIYDDAVLARLKNLKPRSVICTHMLEHVEDRERLAARLLELLPPDGLFFVTVPSSYHEHHNPIDTMYRPTPEQLASLFAGHRIERQAELTGDTYWSHIRQRPFLLIGRHVGRFLTPFLGWGKWKRSMRKLYWLFNPYKVAAVAGRKV
jgi:SAM-dependent methyltransferase